jgi:DNA transformation protein
MFGGAGIYRDGMMFALVSGGEVFLKGDVMTAERFRSAGCKPFTYSRRGKPVDLSYWSIPAEAIDDPDALRPWAELAIEAASRAGKR